MKTRTKSKLNPNPLRRETDVGSIFQQPCFWGHYRCLRCGVDGTLRGRCESAAEAIGRAFSEHHVPKHGLTPRPRAMAMASRE